LLVVHALALLGAAVVAVAGLATAVEVAVVVAMALTDLAEAQVT
jgi:hypothetical protein